MTAASNSEARKREAERAEQAASNSESGLSRPQGPIRGTDGVEVPNGPQIANLTSEQREWVRTILGLRVTPPPNWGVYSVIESIVREHRAEAWDEGANAAVEPLNTGTRMTLRAVLPFPANPYRGDDHD